MSEHTPLQLDTVFRLGREEDLAEWNDEHTDAEVIDLLDRAIATRIEELSARVEVNHG